MIKNEDIICISSIDWDFIWQIPQEMMAKFAENGNRVLFIDNLGIRMPRLKDSKRIKKRILNWLKGVSGIRQERNNLFVFSAIILPFPYSRLARWINKHILLLTLRKWFKVMNFSKPIIWVFLPSPLALDLISELNNKLTVYYCADKFSASSSIANKVKSGEISLLKKSDLIFVTSKELYDYCSQYSKVVYLLSGGVNFELFDKFNRMQIDRPAELTKIESPLIGYVGGIHKWVDQNLLVNLAKMCPQSSYVFIGPIQEQIKNLMKLENTYFIDTIEHSLLPKFIKFFDVAIIPYLCLDYTNNVFPVKLNEYFAMGKPVISTPLPEILAFNQRNDNLVYIAANEKEFHASINRALKDNNPELVERRIEVAKSNSWDRKFSELSNLIIEKIDYENLNRQLNWKKSFIIFYIRARRKLLIIAFIIAMVYLSLFYTSFVWRLAEPLRIEDSPQVADAIVVFAGGVGESGKATQGYEERVEQAVRLYKLGLARYIIFSSGYMYYFEEPAIMKALAVSLGVPKENIILETKAKSTYDNVVFVKKILEEYGWDRILLISAPYHMKRVSLVMNKNASRLKVVYVPVSKSVFYRHGVDEKLNPIYKQLNNEQLKAIIHEYLGIFYYWIKGWI